MGWLFVPGLERLNDRSSLPLETTTDVCVHVSVMSSQRPFSRIAARKPGLRILSSTISQPSTASRGADAFRLSVPEYPALRSAAAENSKEKMTSAGSGLTSKESSMRSSRKSFSLKMSQESLFEDWTPSPKDWPEAALMLHGTVFPQAPWGPAIEGGGGFSSLWPTPTETDFKASGAMGYSTDSGRHSGVTLTDAAVRGPRHPTIPKGGGSGWALNPRFVSELMGLNARFAEIDATCCERLGRQSSPKLGRRPSSS